MPKVNRARCQAVASTRDRRCKKNVLENHDFCSTHCIYECAICLNPISFRERFTLECMHRFHKNCIIEWVGEHSINLDCPLCRHRISDALVCKIHPPYVYELLLNKECDGLPLSIRFGNHIICLDLPSGMLFQHVNILTDMITSTQEAKLKAEQDKETFDQLPLEQQNPKIKYQQRVINYQIGTRRLQVVLPTSERQMTAINILLDALVNKYDQILQFIQNDSQRVLSQFGHQ